MCAINKMEAKGKFLFRKEKSLYTQLQDETNSEYHHHVNSRFELIKNEIQNSGDISTLLLKPNGYLQALLRCYKVRYRK